MKHVLLANAGFVAYKWVVLRSKQQQLVLKMVNYVKILNPEKNLSWLVTKTAEVTYILRISVPIKGMMALQQVLWVRYIFSFFHTRTNHYLTLTVRSDRTTSKHG